MINDRDQKRSALQFSVANRWFPQLEVEVEPGRSIREKAALVTDLDVLCSVPDHFRGFRAVVFDCKTKAKESPVNRALWLRGVLDRLNAEQGFCILRKGAIELDHRLLANRLGVILLTEDEFDLYGKASTQGYGMVPANLCDIGLWDRLFQLVSRFPKLEPAFKYLRSTYWMADDPAEACRKTLATLRGVHPELDPAKVEHLTVFFEFAALFARSLALLVNQIFKAYLHPSNQAGLSEALLVMLYGGREAYQHRNELFKLVKASSPEQPTPDLSLPEWDRFIQLARQLLDAPVECQRVPLILREVGFTVLSGDKAFTFAQTLCSETPQGVKFAMLITNYLGRATKLPQEFGKAAEEILLPLLTVR
jgi:hypothetical protein